MDKIAIAFIVSALLTVCVSMNAPGKKSLQLRQANVNCSNTDLLELARLAGEFNECKKETCSTGQTSCSCCSGRSDDCCDAFDAGLELYRLCKDKIEKNSRKRTLDSNTIQLYLKLYDSCKSVLRDRVASSAGSVSVASFGGILVLLLFISFL